MNIDTIYRTKRTFLRMFMVNYDKNSLSVTKGHQLEKSPNQKYTRSGTCTMSMLENRCWFMFPVT